MNFCKTFFSLFLLSALLLSCSPNKGEKYPSIVATALGNNRLGISKKEGAPTLKLRRLSKEEAKERFNIDYSKLPVSGCFILENENFPVGQEFELITIQGGSMGKIGVYVVNEKQQLVLKEEPTFLLSDFPILEGSNFCPGEEVAYGVISTDGKMCESIIHTPFPIQTSWEDGAMASISYASKEKNLFYLRLKNFKPNEIINCTSISENESMSYPIGVLEDGSYMYLVFPEVIGVPHGNSKMIIHRTGFEAKTLEYTYGNS